MAVKTLYKAGALGAGSQLWVMPQLESSTWAKTLDWYLNFQIYRAHQHRPQTLSEPLKEILNEEELQTPTISTSQQDPLLISCQDFLPANMVVELSDCEEGSSWCKSAHHVWIQLGKPTLRLFLPKFISVKEFEDLWPAAPDQYDISLVPAQEEA